MAPPASANLASLQKKRSPWSRWGLVLSAAGHLSPLQEPGEAFLNDTTVLSRGFVVRDVVMLDQEQGHMSPWSILHL